MQGRVSLDLRVRTVSILGIGMVWDCIVFRIRNITLQECGGACLLRPGREDSRVLKVFVGDVANRRLAAITLFVQICEVAIDVFFRAMELKVQATLGIGKGSDVE